MDSCCCGRMLDGGVCGGGSLFPGTDYGAKKAAGYMKLTYLRIEP